MTRVRRSWNLLLESACHPRGYNPHGIPGISCLP